MISKLGAQVGKTILVSVPSLFPDGKCQPLRPSVWNRPGFGLKVMGSLIDYFQITCHLRLVQAQLRSSRLRKSSRC